MRKWSDAIAWLAIALITIPTLLVMSAFGMLLLVFLGVLYPWEIGNFCISDKPVKAANVGGFDFEFEDANCDVIAKFDVQMIFVSHHGQHQRHRLAVYVGSPYNPTYAPQEIFVAPRTVRLSLG